MAKPATAWLDQLFDASDSLAHRARLKLGSLQASDSFMLDDLLLEIERLADPVPPKQRAKAKAPGEDARRSRRFWAIVAVKCLARKRALGRRAAAVVAALIDIARALLEVLRLDESARVRADAARALIGLPRTSTTAAAPALLAALQDEDEEVPSAAAIALKFVPLPAPTSRVGKAILVAANRHPSEDVRSQLDVVVKRLARSQRKRRAPPQPRPPR